MKLKTGSVVAAEAGRDCGGFFVVTDIDENRVYIADGKSRKLKCPKAKNIKHIRLTNSMIDLNDMTYKKLRAALRTIREAE